MGVFDQAARYAAETEPEAVVNRVLAEFPGRFRFHEWRDTRTTPRPGETERTADRVAALTEATIPQQPWLLILEFQAQHDPDKLDVTLVEAGRLRLTCRHGEDRQGKYNVLTGLVYLRGTCREAVLDMTLSGGLGTRHAALVWNVAEDNAPATLDAVAAGKLTWGLLFWVPLMNGGGDPVNIARWKDLAAARPSGQQRGDLARIALIFAELAGCYLAWEQGLEGFNMTESQVVNRWMQETDTKARLETRREDLLRFLQKRLPEVMTPEVIAAINAQPSLSLLNDWYDAAITASSPEEFLAALRK
jgi:hypothetical protein